MVALLAVSLTLVAPVPGPVAREFAYGADPFRAGWHRGADFAAAPGVGVRAACAGRVAWAGGGVVTLRCGAWRVTQLPLATIAVARGGRVRAGAPIGTVGRDERHAGLHVGVRRAGNRFAYVDPVPLIAASPRPVPVAPAPRTGPRVGAPRAVPRGPPRAVPRVAVPRPASPRSPPRLSAPSDVGVRVLAPWPAWLGLAVLLVGAGGGGVRIRLRRRRAAVARERVA